MKKLRSDSSWSALSIAQKQALEGWLFEEGFSYREVVERAEKEFGINTSIASLASFHKRLLCERKVRSYDQIHDWHEETFHDIDSLEFLQTHLLNLVHVTAFDLALAEPGKLKVEQIATLMNILLQNRKQETREQRLSLDIEVMAGEAKIAEFKEIRAQSKTLADLQARKGDPKTRAMYERLGDYLENKLYGEAPKKEPATPDPPKPPS